jgi:transposase InsO family protein
MRFAFIEQYRARWPITVMSAVLHVSRSGFYAWRKRPESERSKACFEYIEAFYNRERKHSALGYVRPQEYEARYERSVRDAG